MATFGGGRRDQPADEDVMEQIDMDYPGDGDRPPEWLTEYYDDDEYQHQPHHYHHDPSSSSSSSFKEEDFAGFSPYSLQEILEICIEPTVRSGLLHVGKLLFWCLVFRISTQSVKLPPWLCHLLSATTGTVALAHFFYVNVSYLLVLSLVSYGALLLAHKVVGAHRGFFVTASCLTFNTISELFVASPQDWHQIRGAQMMLTMKAISLGFDMDDFPAADVVEDAKSTEKSGNDSGEPLVDKTGARRRRNRRQISTDSKDDPSEKSSQSSSSSSSCDIDLSNMPTVLMYLGYTLCPGNSVFGPWTTFADYLKIYKEPRWNPTWLVKITLSMVYGFMFLTISTCWNPWMIPDGIWIWWTAYRDAMSFRASHYFVSYISEASAVTAGFGGRLSSTKATKPGTAGKEGDGPAAVGRGWHLQVTQPHDIEIPRSLSEVVKSWNMPMHTWLKNYCFKKTRPYGIFFAVLTTYLASTMLHGLNFQLGAVLLSLGFYTYVEFSLRRRLAGIFNASVCATKKIGEGGDDERYRHKEGELLVMLVNFAFGLLACFNLAYLGVMFNQEGIMDEGYSWRHTLSKWNDLGFVSHWLMLALFVLTLLI